MTDLRGPGFAAHHAAAAPPHLADIVRWKEANPAGEAGPIADDRRATAALNAGWAARAEGSAERDARSVMLLCLGTAGLAAEPKERPPALSSSAARPESKRATERSIGNPAARTSLGAKTMPRLTKPGCNVAQRENWNASPAAQTAQQCLNGPVGQRAAPLGGLHAGLGGGCVPAGRRHHITIRNGPFPLTRPACGEWFAGAAIFSAADGRALREIALHANFVITSGVGYMGSTFVAYCRKAYVLAVLQDLSPPVLQPL